MHSEIANKIRTLQHCRADRRRANFALGRASAVNHIDRSHKSSISAKSRLAHKRYFCWALDCPQIGQDVIFGLEFHFGKFSREIPVEGCRENVVPAQSDSASIQTTLTNHVDNRIAQISRGSHVVD